MSTSRKQKRVPLAWRFFLGFIALSLLYGLLTFRKDAERFQAARAKYEREIGPTFDDLPLPADATVYEPKQQRAFQSRRDTHVRVEAWFERPGVFDDSVKIYETELAQRGWVEFFNDGSRVLFCKTPYNLKLSKSLHFDNKHRFLLQLDWTMRQMTERCVAAAGSRTKS